MATKQPYAAGIPWDPEFSRQTRLLAELADYGEHFASCQGWPTLARYNALFSWRHQNNLGLPIRFIEQQPMSCHFTAHYEPQIYLRGEVQTRSNNWHDFFNMLMWHRYPKTRAAINALHVDQHLSRFGLSNQRSPLENGLTLFDENGIIVVTNSQQRAAELLEHRWLDLFWQDRERLAQQMQFHIIGHSIFEKALKPYVGMTAKALIIEVDELEGADVDALAAGALMGGGLSKPKDLAPLPILGVPGWWDDNQQQRFYLDNPRYFR